MAECRTYHIIKDRALRAFVGAGGASREFDVLLRIRDGGRDEEDNVIWRRALSRLVLQQHRTSHEDKNVPRYVDRTQRFFDSCC